MSTKLELEKWRDMKLPELQEVLVTLHKSLATSRFSIAINKKEAVKPYRKVKRDIARVGTVIREKQLNAIQEG